MSQTPNFFWWSSGFEHPWVSFIESFKLFRINILAQLWGWKIDACCWILALQPSSHRAIVTSLPCDDFAWFFWCVWFIELFEKINKIDSTLWICVERLFRSVLRTVGLGGVTPPPPLWSALDKHCSSQYLFFIWICFWYCLLFVKLKKNINK